MINCTDITCKYNRKEKCIRDSINITTNVNIKDGKRIVENVCANKVESEEIIDLRNKIAENILKEI